MRRAFNRLFHTFAKILPGGSTIRPYLHRLRGVKISKGVFIGDEVYLENEYPECIEIQAGAQIGIRTIVMAHINNREEPGRVIIEKNVWIGPNCVISASPDRELRIGEGAVVGPASVIKTSVSARSFYAPERARHIANVQVPLAADTSYASFLSGLSPLPQSAEKRLNKGG